VSSTRRRLDELKTRARVAGGPNARAQPVAACLEDVLSGCEACCGKHRYWRVERTIDEACRGHNITPASLARTLRFCDSYEAELLVEPARTLVVDIETGGFAGTPVFLIGLVALDDRPLKVVQLLARDYPEEEGILSGLAELMADRGTWVTFNGKSFDEPFLRDRATLHRVILPPLQAHLDVLHLARRAWRDRLPNCRLATLEELILRRPRVGDVPSSDIPELFHHFMRTGNASPLRPVLEHNRTDLLSSVELMMLLSMGDAC
jgi:uncharacterized protein YprB with RNaseH-like and TPR domain